MAISMTPEFRRRLAEWDERPFLDSTYLAMLGAAEDSSDDVFILYQLFCEAQIRLRKKPKSKARKVEERVRPLLENLLGQQFPDDPDAEPGVVALPPADDWPEEGLLAVMGYHVGERDPGIARRRAILTQVFEGPIPNVQSPEYMADWGRDRMWPRLKKLSWSLASFANNRLRQLGGTGKADTATRTWAEDLKWLRAEYYEGHFRFPWPEVDL